MTSAQPHSVADAMVRIPISAGQFVLIDEPDLPLIEQWRWTFVPTNDARIGYAARWSARRTIYMHRQLLDAPKGLHVDHANGSGLDNRRSNLRLATVSQNAANRRRADGRYRGVYLSRRKAGFKAQAKANGRSIHLGHFHTAEAAARAYDAFARQQWGEFAVLNFS